MTTKDTTPDEGENVTECSPEDIPLSEVREGVPVSGFSSIDLHGSRADSVEISVVPVREPGVPEDVQLSFGVGAGSAMLTMEEDDAVALIEAIQSVLEVEPFDE